MAKTAYGLAVTCFGALAVLGAARDAHAQIAVGENVNMVTGRKMPGGDPFLQRQNEPSVAVGSLTSSHLLAGANDYRTVDIPFPDAPEKAAGDAWAGVFKSLDGGRTWQSTLLPGYPQDPTTLGSTSPLRICRVDPPPAGSTTPVPVKCVAAADPVVRAGTDGLFYYAGIAFTRDALSSKVYVARFLDGNDKENGDVTEASDPIRYRDAAVIATGGPIPASPICPSGAATHPYVFVDKPWIAVDVPRGFGTCKLVGNKPAGAVYAVYTAFRVARDCRTGADQELSSDVMFSASYDCGATWTAPSRINTANSILNQGATLAIEPVTGRVYVAWRRIASGGQTDAILATRSFGRKKQFSNPRVVAKIVPFDQGGTYTRIRTQSMPALAISTDGARSWAHLAWSQRAAPLADARVVVSTAQVYPPPGGDQDDDEAEEIETETRVAWSPPAVADGSPIFDDARKVAFDRGHQFMPALTFGQGRVVLVWYDSRLDHTRGLYTMNPVAFDPVSQTQQFTLSNGRFYAEHRREVGGRDPDSPASANGAFFATGTPTSPGFEVFDDWAPFRNIAPGSPYTVAPQNLQEVRRTLDVRVAMAEPGAAPSFRSAPVTSFGMGLMNFRYFKDQPTSRLQQLAANPPNLPIFKKVTQAFFGDYIDVQGQAFVQDGGTWTWNSAWNGAPVFHAVWTTNQNVRPPADGNWANYTPVRLPDQAASFYDPGATPSFCTDPAAGNEGSRNQDVYTSRISEGLVVSSPQNAKPLGADASLPPSTFVVAAQNVTAGERKFRFALAGVPSGVSASFSASAPLPFVDVVIPAYSSAARSAFARLTSAQASPLSSFAITVTQVGGCGGAGQPACLSGAVTVNPPGTVSSVLPPDGCTPPETPACNVALGELWSSASGSAVLGDANNQPSVLGPTAQNTTGQNPTAQNPTAQNPTAQNAAVSDYSVDLTNVGNTATSYHLQVVRKGDVEVPRPLQVIVTKFYMTPFAAGCRLYDVANGLTEVNVPDVSGALAATTDPVDPNVPDSRATNVTVSLAPGETKTVTLRGFVPLDQMAKLGSKLAIAAVPHGGLPGSPTYGDLVVIGAPTTTTLGYDAANRVLRATVATSSPTPATGAVTFVVDGAFAGVRALSSGVAELPFTPAAGTRQQVVAFYAGDATHQSSVSATFTAGAVTPIRLRTFYASGTRASFGVSQGAVAIPDATVIVNGQAAPYSAGTGTYDVRLASPVPAGGTLTVQVDARGARVTGTGTVPDAPTITAPDRGSTFAIAALPSGSGNASPITVAWSAPPPTAGFRVWGSWSEANGTFGSTPIFVAASADTRFDIPALALGSGTPRIKVEAVNRGSLSGDREVESFFDVWSGEATVGITSGPIQFAGSMDAGILESVAVYRGNGSTRGERLPTCDAVVRATDDSGTIDRTARCQGASGSYFFVPPVDLPPNTTLRITAAFDAIFSPPGSPAESASVTGLVPDLPAVVHFPTPGATLTAGANIVAGWAFPSTSPRPQFFEPSFYWTSPTGALTSTFPLDVPGTVDATSMSVPAGASAALGSTLPSFRLTTANYAQGSASCSASCFFRIRSSVITIPVFIP
jgi:hypothetical protein